jgi:hypothetical protein
VKLNLSHPEQVGARQMAFAHAVDFAKNFGDPARDIIADANKFYAFLIDDGAPTEVPDFYKGMSYEQASREATHLIEQRGWYQNFHRLAALREIMKREARRQDGDLG